MLYIVTEYAKNGEMFGEFAFTPVACSCECRLNQMIVTALTDERHNASASHTD